MFAIPCRLKRRLAGLGAAGLACLASLFLGLAVSVAHEGHDHGDGDKSAVVAAGYPRVAARSDLYEIVGILRDGRFSIFIDDAVTNEPISDATLQVTVGDAPAIEATRTPDGIYTAALPDRKLTGSVEVIFSINARKGDDLLVDSLTLPQAASVRPKARPWLGTGMERRPRTCRSRFRTAVRLFAAARPEDRRDVGGGPDRGERIAGCHLARPEPKQRGRGWLAAGASPHRRTQTPAGWLGLRRPSRPSACSMSAPRPRNRRPSALPSI